MATRLQKLLLCGPDVRACCKDNFNGFKEGIGSLILHKVYLILGQTAKILVPFLWDLEIPNLVTMWTYYRVMSGVHDLSYKCLFFRLEPKK